LRIDGLDFLGVEFEFSLVGGAIEGTHQILSLFLHAVGLVDHPFERILVEADLVL
jgi:hypothetical protein